MLARAIVGDRPARITALSLGFAVLVLLAIYSAAAAWQADSWIASGVANEIGLSRDGSMGEIVNYGLAFLASVLFFLAFIENRSPLLFFLSLLMAFVWFDDSARYHERLGDFLAKSFNLPGLVGLRPQDTGEVIAWALAGLVLGLVLLFCLPRRRPGDLGVLALVSVGFGLLVLCGIVVDLAHVAVGPRFELAASVIEDGGEMVAALFL